MVNRELVEYLKTYEGKGFSEAQLKDRLSKAGYSSQDVEDALSFVSEGKRWEQAQRAPAKRVHWKLAMGVLAGLVGIVLIGVLVLQFVPASQPVAQVGEGGASAQGAAAQEPSARQESILTDFCADLVCGRNEVCVAGDCVLLSCGEFGRVCEAGRRCSTGTLPASDAAQCCPGVCEGLDPCLDVVCQEGFSCVEGKCELQSCQEMGGTACQEGWTCSSGLVDASDGSCCLDACRGPCFNVTCPEGESCSAGVCAPLSCEELDGEVCEEGFLCDENLTSTPDTDECCLGACVDSACVNVTCAQGEVCERGECIPTLCEEMGGQVCAQGFSCDRALVQAQDTGECCLGACLAPDPCEGVVCAQNERCDEGSCVLLSCVEQEGVICDQSMVCANPLEASDTQKCCASGCVEPTGETVQVQLTARQFAFEPDTILADLGDTVHITAASIDVTHGVDIPAFGVSEAITTSTLTEIEFLADKVGEFEFTCNEHCGTGSEEMRGVIIVS